MIVEAWTSYTNATNTNANALDGIRIQFIDEAMIDDFENLKKNK